MNNFQAQHDRLKNKSKELYRKSTTYIKNIVVDRGVKSRLLPNNLYLRFNKNVLCYLSDKDNLELNGTLITYKEHFNTICKIADELENWIKNN
jgi:hypothetical protein